MCSSECEQTIVIRVGVKMYGLKNCCGHGRTVLFNKKFPMSTIDEITEALQPTVAHVETKRLLRQHRRSHQAVAALKLIIGNDLCSNDVRTTWECLDKHVLTLVVDSGREHHDEAELVSTLGQAKNDPPMLRIKLMTSSRAYPKR